MVEKVNGRKILILDDFAAAVKNPTDGYDKIEFEEDPHEIYLDAKQIEEDAAQLQKIYSLPALQHL